jgi:hypothetical protein
MIEITTCHGSSHLKVPQCFSDPTFCPATMQEMVSMCESPSAAKAVVDRIQSAMQGGQDHQIYIENQAEESRFHASRIVIWINSRYIEVLIEFAGCNYSDPMDIVPSCLQFESEDGTMDTELIFPSTYHYDDGWTFGVSSHWSMQPGLDVFELARKAHEISFDVLMWSSILIEYRSFLKCIRQPMTFSSKKAYSFTMKGRSNQNRGMLDYLLYDKMGGSVEYRAWGAAILGEGFSDLRACYSLFSAIPMGCIRISAYRVEFDGADDGTFNTWAILNDDAHARAFYLTELQVRICAVVAFLFVRALELLSEAHDEGSFDRMERCCRLCRDMQSLSGEFMHAEDPVQLNRMDSEWMLNCIGKLLEEAPELFEPEDVRVALERVQQTLEKSEGRSV